MIALLGSLHLSILKNIGSLLNYKAERSERVSTIRPVVGSVDVFLVIIMRIEVDGCEIKLGELAHQCGLERGRIRNNKAS